jgi:putative ABC transport system substrate-binding protein
MDAAAGVHGAAAWPFAARAQQPGVPVIGFVNEGSADGAARRVAAFRQGLEDIGYVDGQNVAIDAYLSRLAGGPARPDLQTAARVLGMRSEVAAGFATIVEQRAGALLIAPSAISPSLADQIISLAGRYAVPTLFFGRRSVERGGLASYGVPASVLFRPMGVYTGRILKGEKPVDLPVQQATKIELVINLKTAKALGLTIPETLLATADEVIE